MEQFVLFMTFQDSQELGPWHVFLFTPSIQFYNEKYTKMWNKTL